MKNGGSRVENSKKEKGNGSRGVKIMPWSHDGDEAFVYLRERIVGEFHQVPKRPAGSAQSLAATDGH